MNWIKVSDQMPEIKDGSTDIVLAWLAEVSTRKKFGVATTAFYSESSGEWIDGNGPVSKRGWTVTHWAKIEPPKFDSGPIAAD